MVLHRDKYCVVYGALSTTKTALALYMTNKAEFSSNSSFAERLKCVINGGSIRGFAHKCGISEGALRNYLSGGEPTRPTLIAITAATGVSLLWLASGQGPMRDGENDDFSAGPETAIAIFFYDLQASAGHNGTKGEISAPPKHLAFQSAWLRDKTGLNHEDLLLVTVVGDAMEPTLKQGDVVLVNRAKAHVPDDGLYVLLMDGTMLVKRLRKRPGRKVQVTSDNEAYGSFDFDLADPPEDMTIIGRVVWCGREL